MNIGLIARNKLAQITNPNSPRTREDLNNQLDRMIEDLRRAVQKINGYSIDLGLDVTGTLSPSRLAVASPTGLAFLRDDGTFAVPPVTDNLLRVAYQQTRENATTTDQNHSAFWAAPSGTTAVDAETSGAYVEYTSGAVAGNLAGWAGNSTFTESEYFPQVEIRLKTPVTMTNLKFWLGLNTAGTAPNSDTNTSCIAFRYSTAASDPGWVGVCNNGGLQTVSGKVADIAASTIYRLKITVVSMSQVDFSVNGGAVVSVTTNVPVTKHLTFHAQVVTTEAVAKKISLNRFYCQTN